MKTNGTEGGGECEECERGRRHRQQRGEETASTTGGEEEAEARKGNGGSRREEVPGVPEGMDPETGNYIRQPPKKIEADPGAAGDDGDQQQQKRKQYDANIVLDPNKLGVVGKADKGTWTGTMLKRGQWSRRLASTLTNRSRSEEEDSEHDDIADCVFGGQIRFTIMVICTLCLSAILSNILTFNFTYICMAGERPENFTEMMKVDEQLAEWEEEEWEELGYHPDLDYSSQQRSMLFMAVAVGALLTVFPLTVLLGRFGSRLVFGTLGYISAISTLLLPLSAKLGFPYILGIRIIQGAAFSACLPVMGSITSNWSALKQNGIFIAILSSFLQIAPIFTMPISGALCTSSVGWPAVYYLHGAVSLVLFTLFLLYHRNSPVKHPLMSRTELVKVMFGKGSIYSGPGRQNSKKSKKVPYRAMYADRAIWAILVASFGNFMGTQLSLQFMPTYINKVLYMPVERTGVASAISPIIMFFIKLLAGQSSDRIKFISDQWKLRIYNTLSMGMMGSLFIILALLNPHAHPTLCLVVLIASTCILGFNSGGFFKSSQMVSRQHSHFTLANISFLNCVCMLLTPLLNELIAPENAPADWAIVLWIHGLILLSTNAFFCLFSSAKAAPWTLDRYESRKTTKTDEKSERRGRRTKSRKRRVGPAGENREEEEKDVEKG